MDYKKSVKEVAASACRAFGAIISRSKVHGGLPYEIFCKLYELQVWPVVTIQLQSGEMCNTTV